MTNSCHLPFAAFGRERQEQGKETVGGSGTGQQGGEAASGDNWSGGYHTADCCANGRERRTGGKGGREGGEGYCDRGGSPNMQKIVPSLLRQSFKEHKSSLGKGAEKK